MNDQDYDNQDFHDYQDCPCAFCGALESDPYEIDQESEGEFEED